MLTLRQYYLFALWFPIIVPAIIFTLHYINNAGNPAFMPEYLSLLMLAAIYGGIQYVFFCIFAMFYFRNSTGGDLKKFSYKAPLWFLPICIVGLLMFFITDHALSTTNTEHWWLLEIIIASLFILPIGYFYVGMAHLIGFILKKLNVIKVDNI